MVKIAVIQFPGSNCEQETVQAIRAQNVQVDTVLWHCDKDRFFSYDAYVLPGGFSYQDRVRAGAIASKLSIIQFLQEANEMGRFILGICNGCQILAEAGFIPNIMGDSTVETVLAPNQIEDSRVGFICDWTYVKLFSTQQNKILDSLTTGMVLPIPINHGEGRFVFKGHDESTLSDFSVLKYCTANGELDLSFPTNPNGSQFGIAGVGNKAGNVLAMMPHPERAAFLKQIPLSLECDWSKQREGSEMTFEEAGPWMPLFKGLCRKN